MRDITAGAILGEADDAAAARRPAAFHRVLPGPCRQHDAHPQSHRQVEPVLEQAEGHQPGAMKNTAIQIGQWFSRKGLFFLANARSDAS